MEPREALQVIGSIVVLVGLGLMAYPVSVLGYLVFPYLVVGAIVMLIGVITIVTGFAIPKETLPEEIKRARLP